MKKVWLIFLSAFLFPAWAGASQEYLSPPHSLGTTTLSVGENSLLPPDQNLGNLDDGDKATALAFNSGANPKPWVLVRYGKRAPLKEIQIRNGMANSSAEFAKYGRVKKIKIILSENRSFERELKDHPKLQKISFPPGTEGSWFKVELVEFYPGPENNKAFLSDLFIDIPKDKDLGGNCLDCKYKNLRSVRGAKGS
ncbi:MAG: hypothetical protein R3257_04350 [bacterium]|nr:hypothetical protein [bacterium]